MKSHFYTPLKNSIEKVIKFPVSEQRQQVLQPLINFIRKKKARGEKVNLCFVCTHNSRRSQLSQIWAKTAAAYYDIEINSYSGGVEVTEFNPHAVEAIKKAGFSVSKNGDQNPKYLISYSEGYDPITAYSKLYDDPANDSENFAAIMNCAEADENCPFIPGAEIRIPIRYEDPKIFDNTPEEKEKYEERSLQIASEMFYVFDKVKD